MKTQSNILESIIYFKSKKESTNWLKENNFRFWMKEGCDLTFINNDNFKVYLRRYRAGGTSIFPR